MTCIERPRFSCVLGGALATINALPKVIPIIHAAQGCGGNLFTAAYAGSGYHGSGYCGGQSMPSSNVTEQDIIFGGVERLEEEIKNTFELINAENFIVVTGCMTEIIADDVAGVVKNFQNGGHTIFFVETGGFRGNSYDGYEKIMSGIFCHLVNFPGEKDENLVNILGIIPAYDPFFRGDLEEIKRVLTKLGLRVNTFFTPDQNISNIKSAGSAALNIVFSQSYGVDLAEKIKNEYGIPFFITDLPIGALAMEKFLKRLAEYVKIPEKTLHAVLEEENRVYYAYVDKIVDLYADMDFRQNAVVVSNANGAVPFSRFVYHELSWNPEYVYVTDSLSEIKKKRITEAFAAADIPETSLVFETDTTAIKKRFLTSLPQFRSEKYFDSFSPAYILGSSLEKDLASSLQAALLTVSFPILNRLIADKSYAGWRGGLHLMEDIVSTLLQNR
jgi:nitrogenase molybdenum-iron protein beta chain